MQTNTKKTLKYYWKAGLNYKLTGFLVFLAVALASSVGAFTPLFFRQFFNVLASAGPSGAGQLVRILIYIAILEGLGWIFWRASGFSATYFQSHVIADLDNQSFQYLHKHSFNFFDNNFVGSLVKRVKWFSRAFEVVSDQIAWALVPLLVNIVIIFVVLLNRSVYLGFGVLLWTLLFLLANFFFAKFKLKYDIQKAKKETETTACLADTITNHKSVKLFNGFGFEAKQFAKISEELQKIRKFSWDLGNIFEGLQGFLVVSFEIGIMYFAIGLWQKGVLTIGDFVLIQSYLISIFNRVWDFGKVLRRIYEALADANEMTEILETPHEITDIPQAKNLKVGQGKIEFQSVDFYYHKTRKVISNFDLTIKPGERVALVGPSGAGKTTIVKLLLRMHDIDKGKIKIDSQDIAKVTQASLRESIVLVPQDPILFHRTLFENIKYGSPKASKKQVIEASKKAQCHQFISQLDGGYETYVGERGIKLSGGERQRIAIARAILRNTPILVLDEATSSLDSESERLIQKAISELMENKTVIVIAHRLSTIRKMDRIIVVDKGKVIEQGSHNQLIEKEKGLYRALWQIQAGSFMVE